MTTGQISQPKAIEAISEPVKLRSGSSFVGDSSRKMKHISVDAKR